MLQQAVLQVCCCSGPARERPSAAQRRAPGLLLFRRLRAARL